MLPLQSVEKISTSRAQVISSYSGLLIEDSCIKSLNLHLAKGSCGGVDIYTTVDSHKGIVQLN